jgi:hypothetical protein
MDIKNLLSNLLLIIVLLLPTTPSLAKHSSKITAHHKHSQHHWKKNKHPIKRCFSRRLARKLHAYKIKKNKMVKTEVMATLLWESMPKMSTKKTKQFTAEKTRAPAIPKRLSSKKIMAYPNLTEHRKLQHQNNTQERNQLWNSIRAVSPLKGPQRFHQGIYLTQNNFENEKFFKKILKQAELHHIDTFIIDLHKSSSTYVEHLQKLHQHNIFYIPRVIIFPKGGTEAQIRNPKHWQRKWPLIKQAVHWGASAIQLDYIRYRADNTPKKQNSKNIHTIIKWYNKQLDAYHIPVQVALFGIVSYRASHGIGQDLNLFAEDIDAVCPMLYPSHFKPYKKSSNNPYKTVFDAIRSIHKRIPPKVKPNIYAYIEIHNFRHPLKKNAKREYIRKQILASYDAKANGWYAWSANNHYGSLFTLLEQQPSLIEGKDTIIS